MKDKTGPISSTNNAENQGQEATVTIPPPTEAWKAMDAAREEMLRLHRLAEAKLEGQGIVGHHGIF